MSDTGPSFEIPARPKRRYPPSGGVEHEGGTAFYLTPKSDPDADGLDELLNRVLAADRYVRGDFFDLPAPVYLVHDREVSTSFRAVVREDRLELHVLPDTEASALSALYDRLVDRSTVEWTVESRTVSP